MSTPTPEIARLDVSEAVLIADLKAIAARREREGLLAEQARDMKYVNADSPTVPGFEDCPCPMCPPAGVTIPRGATS